MSGLEHILGYKIKVVERAGTPLARVFPLGSLWDGTSCGRNNCTTCNQKGGGDKLPPCTKRNVLYENVCLKCNPKAGDGKPLVKPNSSVPSVSIGESGRSIFERGVEHWKDWEKKKEDSHIHKHHVAHHSGTGTPEFHLRPVAYHKTALSRQVAEAVRIRRRGGSVLNSKSEYNRCSIVRLSLPESGTEPTLPPVVEQEVRDEWKEGQEEQLDREHRKELDDKYGTVGMEQTAKRQGEMEQPGKKPKRWKYDPVPEGWGGTTTTAPTDGTTSSGGTPTTTRTEVPTNPTALGGTTAPADGSTSSGGTPTTTSTTGTEVPASPTALSGTTAKLKQPSIRDHLRVLEEPAQPELVSKLSQARACRREEEGITFGEEYFWKVFLMHRMRNTLAIEWHDTRHEIQSNEVESNEYSDTNAIC